MAYIRTRLLKFSTGIVPWLYEVYVVSTTNVYPGDQRGGKAWTAEERNHGFYLPSILSRHTYFSMVE
jgi:hypothetical protein